MANDNDIKTINQDRPWVCLVGVLEFYKLQQKILFFCKNAQLLLQSTFLVVSGTGVCCFVGIKRLSQE